MPRQPLNYSLTLSKIFWSEGITAFVSKTFIVDGAPEYGVTWVSHSLALVLKEAKSVSNCVSAKPFPYLEFLKSSKIHNAGFVEYAVVLFLGSNIFLPCIVAWTLRNTE